MVRFKVIRGSRLLLGLAMVVLALLLAFFLLQYAAAGGFRDVGRRTEHQASDEEEAVTAFASSAMPSPLSLDPETEGQAAEDGINIEVIPNGSAHSAEAAARILIYHTHTHEAYEQEPNDPYTALGPWRTTDPEHSVVRVGRELTELLRARGLHVEHDTTDYEQDALSTSYTRSLKTLESYTEPFDLYIDLHRDAYVENMGPVTVSASGKNTARLMVLIGRGDDFSVKPSFEENYAFASLLTERLNALEPGICKDVLVKKNRYNQHIGSPALLIEVGNNRNTLTEALAAMPCLADAIASLMQAQAENAPVIQLASED